MKDKKNKLPVLLMVLSMILLVVLQGLWLRSEYRSAMNAFNRETNLVFRSTLHQLSDSLFFSMFRSPLEGVDTIGPAVTMSSDTLAITTRVIQVRVNDTPAGQEGHSSTFDSLRQSTDMRYMLRAAAERFNEDSLAHHYRLALSESHQQLPFAILKRELSRSSRGERYRHDMLDTLPFTTSFVPFGWTTYAASFERVPPFLVKKLLPQIGFSVFITLLILFSFVLVHKSLRAQERLLEQKNDFIGNMTHELKTPVATVGVALEAMRSFDVLKDTEKAAQYIDMASQELNRLGMMTDKIIRTSVYDYESDIRHNKVPVDMSDIIRKVGSSFRLLAEKNGLQLDFHHTGDCHIMGHEDHLTQMIYNMVDNAFKYAGSGGWIGIELHGETDELIIAVNDKGPGIPEQHHIRIFEKFYRVPSGNVHTVKGYGMGLNYVKGVVTSHGGRIALNSKAGEGASFKIRLPR